MMSQAVVCLQNIVNIFSCSRRNSLAPPTGLKKASGVGIKFGNKAGTSRGYRSNESTDLDSDPAVVSTSGSDFEASSLPLRAQKSSYTKPPPGLSDPIGLEFPVRNRSQLKKQVGNDWSNVRAKASVPNTTSRDNKIEECLRDISASSENDLASSLGEVLKRRLEREQNGPAKVGLPPSLQKVLGKLTTEDAAIVKAAFKAKEISRATNPPQTMRAPERANITGENTMRSNMRKLAEIDPKRVFMVRKINKLGLGSPEMLKTYFSKFGPIENVYVTHSVDRRNLDEDPEAKPIVRPAGVGFIVMEKAADVVNIFMQGLDHTISDMRISVTAYEHHVPEEVERNECKHGLPSSSGNTIQSRGPRFPTYAKITEDNTLRSNLRKMAEFDASRIFMVKKINKLGLGSAQMLKTHFGQIGAVTNVFVTHSIDRRKIDPENPNARPHIRPAGIGFVVMENAQDVAAILRYGVEQTVFGVNISLATYTHHIQAEASADGNDQESSMSEEVK